MSSLIKRDASLDLRILPVGAGPQGAEVLETDRDPERAALEDEIEALRRRLRETEAETQKAVSAARIETKREAELAHVRQEEKALALLRAGLDRATKDLEARLVDLESASLLLTQTALEKVFGDPKAYHELIGRAISAQLAGLRHDMVVCISVSSVDFSDQNALKRLADTTKRAPTMIRAEPSLAQGDCRIELKLGEIEFSIGEHWSALQNLLRGLARATRP